MRMPGTNWDTEILRQLETVSQAPISAPTLTGVVDNPVAAEADIAVLVTEEQAFEQELEDLRIPSDPESVDAYMVHMYRKCVGGPYKQGTVRSQRDLFGSVSAPRRIDKTRSAGTDSHQTAETQTADHLLRFVTDISCTISLGNGG
jgi:hypothetical protein